MGEYVDVSLQKPMGIVLEENDPKIKGVYVKSLSQVLCWTPRQAAYCLVHPSSPPSTVFLVTPIHPPYAYPQGGAAAVSGKVQPGDHLVSVQGAAVTGKDLDSVLQSVQAAPAEGVTMKFYRGSLGDVINPRVFFDISIGGGAAGRIVCRLRKDVVPKTVEVRLLMFEWLGLWDGCMHVDDSTSYTHARRPPTP